MKNTTTIRYIDRYAQFTWSANDHVDRITDEGDIVLSLRDIWDITRLLNVDPYALEPHSSLGEFIDLDVLERWAEGWSFNLDGINPFEALWRLTRAFVIPTLEEDNDQTLTEALHLAKAGTAERDEVPDYLVRVDGRLVRLFLVDSFDGPFEEDGEQREALLRRVTPEAV